VPFLGIAAAYAAGVALNAVAPARGGDAAKLALARAEIRGSSLPAIGATMSVLLIFDLLAGTVALILAGVAAGVPLAADLSSLSAAGGWLTGHAPVAAGLSAAAATGVWLLVRRARPRLRGLWTRVRQGGAILRTPRRYLFRVALVQAAAWGCRIAVVMCLLAAFGLPASPGVAALVMVLAGVSTVIPLTPGGAGTQQVLIAYALSQTASAAAVVSFSVGMQVGITAVNATLGIGAAMVACRTLRPLAAVRSRLRVASE
jgi:uncharacterized membrane protein YbhN (UPF0104 family)